MKIILLLVLTMPAMAQRKLWTWRSPIDGDNQVIGALHDAATDEKGNAAFIIGETKYATYPQKEFTRYRLVWVTSKGAVLLNHLVERPEDADQHVVNAEPPAKPWSIVSVSATSWIVTDSKTIWVGKAARGVASITSLTVPDASFAFPANNRSSFAGWFQQRNGAQGAFIYGHQLNSKEAHFATPAEISLWTTK